jgi:uncharacterized protein (TIGR03000 family)
MRRASLSLIGLGLFCCFLALPTPSAAYFRRGGYRSMPVHMPGWDWSRIYPWSPYNYGRNIYNPAIVGYPYPMVWPYPVDATGQASAPPLVVPYRADREPTVSGNFSTPPPGTALIRLRVPEEWAKVQFDGETTSTMGLRRYFVTPTLEDGKTYSYVMTVSWKKNGQTVRDQRVVKLRAGEIKEIDLDRPESGKKKGTDTAAR